MYDAMFIVHALEQSPVYWNFCTLIKAGVLYIFEVRYYFKSKLLLCYNRNKKVKKKKKTVENSIC